MSFIQAQRRAITPLLFVLCVWMISNPAFAGAGGTQGQKKQGFLMILLLLPILLGIFAYRSIMKAFAKSAARAVVRRAAARDSVWNQDQLKRRAQGAFMEIQQHWSNNDVEGAKALLHENYEKAFLAELNSLVANGQVNKVSNVRVSSVDIILAKDYADDSQDQFVALIKGQMDDALYSSTGQLLRTQGNREGNPTRIINEYWTFQRTGDSWLLSNISQTHDAVVDEVSIDQQSLAQKHGEGIKLERAVARAQAFKERSKSVQKLIAGSVGLAITVGGYWVYFQIFKGMWRMITRMF
jgi:hypothetical protein